MVNSETLDSQGRCSEPRPEDLTGLFDQGGAAAQQGGFGVRKSQAKLSFDPPYKGAPDTFHLLDDP